MSVAVMTTVGIWHTSKYFFPAVFMFNHDTPLCRLFVIRFLPFGQPMFFSWLYRYPQPRPKGTRYVVLIRYLYSGFNTSFKRPKAPSRSELLGIKPLNTNKLNTPFSLKYSSVYSVKYILIIFQLPFIHLPFRTHYITTSIYCQLYNRQIILRVVFRLM
jgi:hypothetical protein